MVILVGMPYRRACIRERHVLQEGILRSSTCCVGKKFNGRTGFYWKVHVIGGHVLHNSMCVLGDHVLLVNMCDGYPCFT